MKTLHIITGLLVIGLLAQSGLAKTKSRNGRTQRQAYLPPRANSGPSVTEEYITIHEAGPRGGRAPFQESNYGDGKYQIFEVHSHYEPPATSGATHANFNAPGYLPPRQEVRVEHVHQAPSLNSNRLNLGSSGARGGIQHAPQIPAPAVSVAFPSNFNHEISNSQSQSISAGSSASYTPPVQEEVIRVQHIHVTQLQNNGQQHGFQATDYLPPHVENSGAQHSQSTAPLAVPEYRAPDYLPPHAGSSVAPHAQPAVQLPVAEYLAPDNLPPHQAQPHIQQPQTQGQHHEGTEFKGSGYLPPQQQHTLSHPVAIQSTNYQQQQHSIAHHQQSPSFKGPNYLPPHSTPHQTQQNVQFTAQSTDQYKAPDYLPPPQEHYEVAHQHIEQHQQVSHSNQFKGPDYLPPHPEHQAEQHHHHDAQSTLSEHHHQHSAQPQTAFKGPDYLPPHHESHQEQQHVHEVQQHVQQPQTVFKGPDYLPPHHESHHEQQHVHEHQQHIQQPQTAFKGPDYLPPHQESQAHQQDLQPPLQSQPGAYKGPDYLPPNPIQQQQSAYKGPDYLPPNQEYQSHHQQVHQQISHQSTAYKGPDYLPPHQAQSYHHESDHQQQVQQHHTQQHSTQFRGPDYLPPHQEQHVAHNEVRHQTQTHPGSLPAAYEPQTPAVPIASAPQPQQTFQHPLPQPTPQHQTATVTYQASSSLPQGYDFDKPANAEQAIAELHTLPEEQPLQQEVVVQSQIQVSQGQQQADIIYGRHQSGVNYQNNGYLPPHQSAANYHSQQANIQLPAAAVGSQQNVQQHQQGAQQVAPQTFTPTPAAPVPAPNYLPPATPVQAHQYSTNLHSLSSYMTNVQPFQRYASAPRQPFREYGPPPANPAPNHAAVPQQHQQQHNQQPQPITVAAMYREQASRPPYYAPAMSYATNSVANSYAVHHTASQQQHATFNQQTRQHLQQFMPSDIRSPSSAPVPQPAAVHSTTAVRARQSTSSKIRTVQILNPAAVKTLKVLETSDHAGVKTIKILGHSNTQPTGEHHIVKVVSQNAPNAHEHVQTVKIFNDQEEVPSQASGGANGYLPPSVRVARQSPLKLQLLSNEKYRRPFTGRHRYRY